MAIDIGRRQFVSALGGAAAWPLVARAQQPALPIIGVLGGGSPTSFEFAVASFVQGLDEEGYDDGRNVALNYLWADGQYDRMSAIAAEFVRRRVTVIVTLGGTPAAQAAKSATSTIPIVFELGTDPVAAGLVASLNRPGGNLTGWTSMTVDLAAKRLEILHDLLPQIHTIAFLTNKSSSTNVNLVHEMEAAAAVLGMQVHFADAQTESDLAPAFEDLVRLKVEALALSGDQFHLSRRDKIVALAASHKIPAIYFSGEYVKAGGLMSYGPNMADSYRQVGVLTGRILKGANPADLPVEQPTKFELVFNLKTAKALGLTVPPTLLARADEMIE